MKDLLGLLSRRGADQHVWRRLALTGGAIQRHHRGDRRLGVLTGDFPIDLRKPPPTVDLAAPAKNRAQAEYLPWLEDNGRAVPLSFDMRQLFCESAYGGSLSVVPSTGPVRITSFGLDVT